MLKIIFNPRSFWFYFRFSGKQSTLFVILFVNGFDALYSDDDFVTSLEEYFKEKLALIPHTKLLIIDAWSKMMEKDDEIPPETLQVYLRKQNGLGALLEHLNKRYKSLDLIAVMMELKRTVLTPYYEHTFKDYDDVDEWHFSRRERGDVEIYENLSCLPRLQKMEQML